MLIVGVRPRLNRWPHSPTPRLSCGLSGGLRFEAVAAPLIQSADAKVWHAISHPCAEGAGHAANHASRAESKPESIPALMMLHRRMLTQ